MIYVIMFLVVLMMCIADIITGIIKAHLTIGYCSTIMRKGLLHKAQELLIMACAIGLQIGLSYIGEYYDCVQLAGLTGAVSAISVFCYLVAQELISILENYCESNPDATAAKRLIKKLKKFNNEDEEEEDE